MRWFEKYRQQWILDFIREHDRLNVKDIMDKFEISKPQASRDIQNFLKEYPYLARYNVKRKCYELDNKQEQTKGGE